MSWPVSVYTMMVAMVAILTIMAETANIILDDRLIRARIL